MTTGLRLELFYDDVAAAVAFYLDVLGFTALPTDDATYRPLALGSIRLSLQASDALTGDHPLVRAGHDAARGQGVEIVLEVDDLAALHERVQAAGVETTPLQLQPWGLADFRLLDPGGYYLRFTTPQLG